MSKVCDSSARGLHEGAGSRESGTGDLIAEFGVAEGQHGVFERSATAQAPILTGHILGGARFAWALGLPGFLKTPCEDKVGLYVFVREHVMGLLNLVRSAFRSL
jgi:hypothetical protein